jgi:hypothetical protein
VYFARLKVVVAVLLTLGLSACSSQKTLSAEEIKIQVADVRSLAAAALLLCETLSKDQTTETFFKTQASFLADKAERAAHDLEGNSSDAEDARQRGQLAAAHLGSVCRTLEDDPSASATSVGQLKELAKTASQIEDGLKSTQ